MEIVRKMSNEDLKKAISKVYKKQMLIWHLDRNPGDEETALQIIIAKDILLDDEKRARYHNKITIKDGSLENAGKHFFRPELYTEKQKKEFRRRMCMFAASLVFVTGGIALSLVTAGATQPLVVILGGVIGEALAGAGVLSLGHTISKQSALEKCDMKSWGKKLAIGAVCGAVAGVTVVLLLFYFILLFNIILTR